MPLDLNDLLKKAKNKGIVSNITTFTKPWHQEAIVINSQSEIADLNTQQYKSIKIISEQDQEIQNNWGTIGEQNREQTGNNWGTIGEQNREQTGNNWGTNREQLGNNWGTIGEQLGNRIGNKQGTIGEQNREQNGLNFYKTVSHTIHSLTGLQKNLFFYLIENCSLNGTLDTSKITNEELKSFLNCSSESAKITIKRLIKKRLLKRKIGKTGRSGFTIFEFDEFVRKIGIEIYNKLTEDKTGNNWRTKQGTTKNSSSSDINDITTDYYRSSIEPTIEFDLEPLADIGFTLNHVKQILKQGKLTASEIQDSINHFAFDLTYNDKLKTIKTNALAFFMGTLKRGDYYNPSSNYESKKARNMRLLLEAKTKRQAQEMEIEQKLKESEYKDWIEQLPDSELVEFYVEEQDISNVPEKIQKTLIRRNALNNARQYFDSEIWPTRKKELESQTF